MEMTEFREGNDFPGVITRITGVFGVFKTDSVSGQKAMKSGG